MKSTNIAGLQITDFQCNQLNEKHINIDNIAKEPLTTIYKNSEVDDSSSYTVNIVAYIPHKIKNMEEKHLQSGFFLNSEKTIFLNYNGVLDVNTPIEKDNNNKALICRNFNIEFEYDKKNAKHFDAYQIKFDYKLTNTKQQSVEAVIVKLINEDPKTSRGTVVTVRNDDN